MPYETDAPLVIDADTVLPPAVALPRWEPVPGGNPQTGQLSSGMQFQELSPCHTCNVLEPGHTLAAEKRLGIGTTERVEHVRIFFCVAESVKQTKKCADDSGMKSDNTALRAAPQRNQASKPPDFKKTVGNAVHHALAAVNACAWSASRSAGASRPMCSRTTAPRALQSVTLRAARILVHATRLS